MNYTVAVIGGGPGGYVAAIRAAQLGAKVALIEKDKLGGTCLNRGCIPTKALVAAAEKLHAVKKAAEFGVLVEAPVLDFSKAMQRKNQVVDGLVTGIEFLIKKNKIDLYRGTGKILSPTEIKVNTNDGDARDITAENIIVATGSEPSMISSLGYDGETVITSDEALTLTQLPESLLIVGGGVIGCEFACIFAEMGTKVTIVEMMPAILPGVDKEVSRQLQSIFKRRGITVKTGAEIKEVQTNPQGAVAVLQNGDEISADKILISIGRKLNTGSLGLEELGVELGSRGEILVNARLATNCPNIYAIGDVTNKVWLAHVASAQGIKAAENIMGQSSDMDYEVVPNCIFTLPEIAGVGLTSQQTEEQGLEVKTGKFPFMALGKARAMGETEGFVKIIADTATDRVLGVHIIGAHATDLIAEGALAVKMGVTVKQLTETIHAHPTIAEAVMEAAEAVHGKSIHM